MLADIGTLLKLKIKDKTPPCTLLFSSSDTNKVIVYCYISDEYRTPNETQNTSSLSFVSKTDFDHTCTHFDLILYFLELW